MSDRLHANGEDLTGLAQDLDDMQDFLTKKIGELNDVLAGVGPGWSSPAATTYQELQRSLNDDTVTVRENLACLEEAVRLSRDGFSAQDLETMETFQRLRDTAPADAPGTGVPDGSGSSAESPAAPSSAISGL